ncbi:selenocysteine-specific elongation factor-like isoform X1 [Aduncisulcus paluster]|uniref:Selenocysteine-specific elongation factor-like isoform X1 n=1 Tax=Aduncisulcus paluster TaxID=2918883 RepID=A0ABQ5JVP6_9EUKA|nr:selenocysteine-specific elongation factor-like isoform X1 [Aduncisulcus paluster]
MSVLNINIGFLGHVDSGKTSITKKLSKISSTACFDKHPQSKARGITLDLGFSAFETDAPDHVKAKGFDKIRFTLVDCPGHASLIKTVLGGAQIVDVIVLVVDSVRGFQAQTAEGLVIAEILSKSLVLALNKVDMLKDISELPKIRKKASKILSKTVFSSSNIVEVSAKDDSIGIDKLRDALIASVVVPDRALVSVSPESSDQSEKVSSDAVGKFIGSSSSYHDPFTFVYDHSFKIRGHGTVFTGTCIGGHINVGERVILPEISDPMPIRSIQVFKESVSSIKVGERAGICISGAKVSEERGMIVSEGEILPPTSRFIALLHPIRFFSRDIHSKKEKYHITIGHSTCLATLSILSLQKKETPLGTHDTMEEDEETVQDAQKIRESILNESGTVPPVKILLSQVVPSPHTSQSPFIALLTLDRPVVVPKHSQLIGSRLDIEAEKSSECRIAFSGSILAHLDSDDALKQLHVMKKSIWKGSVVRVGRGGKNIIIKDLIFDIPIKEFVGYKVNIIKDSGEIVKAEIECAFGEGKIKLKPIDAISGVKNGNLVEMEVEREISILGKKK